MKELPDLKQLTEEAKDALIVLLWEEIQKLHQGQQKSQRKQQIIQVFLPLRDSSQKSKPTNLEGGSPFGPRLMALITTMRYSHGISYGRMQQMLGDVFSLTISEGGIANVLSRVKTKLALEVDGILKKVRTASWLCSDETSARVNGKNQWEWVFQNNQLCLHVPSPI